MKANTLCLGKVVCQLAVFTTVSLPAALESVANSTGGRTEQEVGVIKGRVLAEDGGDPLAKSTVSRAFIGGKPCSHLKES